MAEIIDGKKLAAKIKDDIRLETSKMEKKPGLAVILAGNDPGSVVYVKNKEKDALEVGFHSEVHRLAEDVSEQEVLDLIKKLNEDAAIHGILVQLPLPGGMDEDKVTNSVAPEKDVDGFTYENAGKLVTGADGLTACTPAGCIEMIDSAGVDLTGKNAVVIGRSNIVGKPMAILLLKKHATVTVCHSRTRGLPQTAAKADILVAAIGRAKMIGPEYVKEGAVVIDVGMNRDENGKLCGDVDFEAVKDKASFITPVPGGVGPMTRAMLLKNTLKAYKKQV